MPTNDLFINRSIDLHLFFMRITEEHLVFIEEALSNVNNNLAKKSRTLRNEALNFLCFIMSISNGHISQASINSNELITKYTYNAENLTEYYTGIKIYSDITSKEQSLLKVNNIIYIPMSTNQMIFINKCAIDIANRISNFQSILLENILNCNIYVNIFPDRLDHIIDENKRYIQDLEELQNMNLIYTIDLINEQMIFWNENMSDHGKFTAHLLDPKENELIKSSNEFAEIFDKLSNEAKNAKNDSNQIINVLNKSLQEMIRYKEFYLQGVINILNCKIRSIILPLPAEHDLREINHYLKILYEGKNLHL